MPRYRLDSIAQLAHQMEFAPHEVRSHQLAAAESLLHLIDATKAYPLDFVIYKVTDYRPKASKAELLTGLALQHDLGLLIESVSDTLDLHASALSEPVLAIDDVCERFNVTSKTIQRWRRKGLPARRFVFPDGKRRVGFLLNSVERFVGSHQEQVAPAGNFSQINDAERAFILRHARRLAVECRCSVDEITHRIAGRTNRSPLTILHTLRKHDQEGAPAAAVLPHAAGPVAEADRVAMLKAFRRGAGIAELAEQYSLPRTRVYRALMDMRVHRLLKRKVKFHDDPLYHERDAERTINSILAQEELGDEPLREDLRLPRDLPPYLQELYRTPLLSRSRERALFLKLNYHKYQFVQARRRLDPEAARHRGLCVLESYLAKAAEVKNAIVRANLRLVVSIARKHLRGNAVGLLELVSEGNITLMRAVDSFDVGRGHRFSTYATFALMKGFARSVPQMLTAARRAAAGDDEMLAQVPDRHGGGDVNRLVQRDEIDRLLSGLDARERSVVSAHYGLDGGVGGATYEQVGQRLGLSKERVRQIEQCALAKLRAAAHSGIAEG